MSMKIIPLFGPWKNSWQLEKKKKMPQLLLLVDREDKTLETPHPVAALTSVWLTGAVLHI